MGPRSVSKRGLQNGAHPIATSASISLSLYIYIYIYTCICKYISLSSIYLSIYLSIYDKLQVYNCHKGLVAHAQHHRRCIKAVHGCLTHQSYILSLAWLSRPFWSFSVALLAVLPFCHFGITLVLWGFPLSVLPF